MNADEFVAQVAKLTTENGLTDDQVASALAGIVVELCARNGADPMSFIRWAIRERAAAVARISRPSRA